MKPSGGPEGRVSDQVRYRELIPSDPMSRSLQKATLPLFAPYSITQ